MIQIDYNHEINRHTLEGAENVLSLLFDGHIPQSLIDVGCGPGTWLIAAQKMGVKEFIGVDGIEPDEVDFHVDKKYFIEANLEEPWSVKKKFEVALCLEVAEHLSVDAGPTLISTLTSHSDWIFFSAAGPHQEGQHHINCQWPEYWQNLFNNAGYRCEDTIRSRIWTNERIEWWYRQNIFVAKRDESGAGHEPRIAPLIHPESLQAMPHPTTSAFRKRVLCQVESGSETIGWYLSLPFRALMAKISRR